MFETLFSSPARSMSGNNRLTFRIKQAAIQVCLTVCLVVILASAKLTPPQIAGCQSASGDIVCTLTEIL